MFLRHLLRGFATGLGFAAGFMLLTSLVSNLLMNRIRIDIPSSASSPSTTPSSLIAMAPDGPPPKAYSLHVGSMHEMTIPDGGGVSFIAVLRDGRTSGRPPTTQYWLTADQLWRIDTKDDAPTFTKLDYPAADPVAAVEQLHRADIVMESGLTSMIDKRELVRLGQGVNDPSINGIRKVNADGVVWLLPNPR